MNSALHPFFIHFPMALGFLVPMLVIWALVQFKKNEASANVLWTTVVVPFVIMAVFTVLAVITGESSHEVLEKYMDEKPIEAHEELAEVYAGLLYATAGLSLFIYLFKGQRRFYFMAGILALSIVLAGMGAATGKKGGEIVHKYDSPQYMNKALKDGASEKPAGQEQKKEHEHEHEEEHD